MAGFFHSQKEEEENSLQCLNSFRLVFHFFLMHPIIRAALLRSISSFTFVLKDTIFFCFSFSNSRSLFSKNVILDRIVLVQLFPNDVFISSSSSSSFSPFAHVKLCHCVLSQFHRSRHKRQFVSLDLICVGFLLGGRQLNRYLYLFCFFRLFIFLCAFIHRNRCNDTKSNQSNQSKCRYR